MMNRSTCFKSVLPLIAATCFAGGIHSHAQEPAKNPDAKVEPQMGILVEYFELNHRAANKLMREYSAKAADAQGLRDRLGGMIERGESTLVETAWVRARSGQRAKTESIRETIYPTEYDPPEIPNTLGMVAVPRKVKPGEKAPLEDPISSLPARETANEEVLMTSATPTAFETRFVGTTVEVDPVLSADNELATLSIAPEMVSLEGRGFFMRPDAKAIPWGVDHISMPFFYTMKTSLQMKAKPGNYNVLGMFTPPDKPDKKIIGLLKVDLVFAN